MEHRRGIGYAVAAYTLWGVMPIFWKAFRDVPALELLAHRIVWSIPVLVVVLALRGRWRSLLIDFSRTRTRVLAVASGLLLAVNWGVYVWAVTNGHIVDASLGYFINPLVSVALGVLVLQERLRPLQWVAVGIATVGVVGMTIMVGVLPWIALSLAFSFGFYGLLKKREGAAPPMEGLLGEAAVLAIPAALYLGSRAADGVGAFGRDATTTLLLLTAGVVTVVPLVLFGAGAQRIPLATVGILQYLAPSLQLVLGIALYGEAMTGADLFGFLLVWIALAVYTLDGLRSGRVPGRVAGVA